MGKKVAVLLAEGFEEVEAVTPVNFLRRAGIEVLVAGINSLEVTGSRGITVKADLLVEKLPVDLDGVIIPGGMPGAANVGASKKAVSLIQEFKEKGKLVAAICAAPVVVLHEAAAIVAGLQVTCYPGMEGRFPAEAIIVDKRVVVDGNVITSQGPGTAAEFSIAIIELLAGKEAGQKVFKSTIQK